MLENDCISVQQMLDQAKNHKYLLLKYHNHHSVVEQYPL